MIGSVWQIKPPPGTPINWRHPLAQGLVACWPLNESSGTPYELANNRAASGIINATWAPSPVGPSLSFAGNGYVQYIGSYLCNTVYTPPFTILAWFNTTSSGAASRIINFGNTGTTTPIVGLVWNSSIANSIAGLYRSDANSTSYYETYNAYNDGKWHCAVGVFVAGVAPAVYVDGAPPTSGGNAVGTVSGTCTQNVLTIGALTRTSVTLYFTGGINSPMVWNRALSPADIASITANPWQIYATPAFNRLLHSAGGVVQDPSGVASDCGTMCIAVP